VALAAVAVAAGCSGAADPAPGPSSTPTATEQAAVGRFADAEELAVAMQDAAREAGTARSQIDARGADGSVRGALEYQYGADLRVRGALDVSGSVSLEAALVLADSTLYLEVPPIYRLFSGAAWVRVPTDGDASADLGGGTGGESASSSDEGAAGQLDALLETLAAGVPGQALLDLADASAVERGQVDLVALGARTVDGRELEGYSAQAEVDGSVVTLVHWIDEDDLLYRLDQNVDDPLTLEPATSVATFDDWGTPVVIEPPDPSDVTDLPDGLL
jgi:hypothetical protein